MADRLSAPLTEDVARKARRAKAHRAITTLPHFRSPHSDFVAREHASGRRARGDRQEFEPEHHRQPERRRRRSRYEDATGISSSWRKSPALRGKRDARGRSHSPTSRHAPGQRFGDSAIVAWRPGSGERQVPPEPVRPAPMPLRCQVGTSSTRSSSFDTISAGRASWLLLSRDVHRLRCENVSTRAFLGLRSRLADGLGRLVGLGVLWRSVLPLLAPRSAASSLSSSRNS